MGKIKHEDVPVRLHLPKVLHKDLTEHEAICPTCHGLGIIRISPNFGVDGISGFPFRQDYFIPCPNCYRGIVRTCEYCGQPIPNRYSNQCNCTGAVKHRENEALKRAQDIWDKAEKLSFEEAINRFEMLYIDDFDRFVYAEELEDYLKDEKTEDPELRLQSLRIYGTKIASIAFDAADLIERACEDLYEDAAQSVTGGNELQALLDQWCKTYGSGTESFFPDYAYAVLVPAEKEDAINDKE